MIRVGQKLHDTRIHKCLSLEDISTATKIRPNFLTAIEKGEYDKLPSPAYAQGFVRNYASYLGLSQKEILALFRREFDYKKNIKVLPDSMTRKQEFSLTRIHIQRSVIAALFFLLVLSGYLLYQYRAIFMPPELIINSPKENSQNKKDITVSGKTDPNATLFINNDPVALNSDGDFNKNLTLFPGTTSITIKAINRFGKETTTRRTVAIKN